MTFLRKLEDGKLLWGPGVSCLPTKYFQLNSFLDVGLSACKDQFLKYTVGELNMVATQPKPSLAHVSSLKWDMYRALVCTSGSSNETMPVYPILQKTCLLLLLRHLLKTKAKKPARLKTLHGWTVASPFALGSEAQRVYIMTFTFCQKSIIGMFAGHWMSEWMDNDSLLCIPW